MELVAMDMKVSVGEIFIGGKNFVANLGALWYFYIDILFCY